MYKLFFIVVILCFCSIELHSQSADLLQNKNFSNSINNSIYKTIPPNKSNRNDVLELDFCDVDGDGYMEFNMDEIAEQVLQLTGLGNDDTESILISTNSGVILKINTPSMNPNIQEICNSRNIYADVAVDELGTIYKCDFGYISQTNENCDDVGNTLFTFTDPNYANSLSFDTDGNMYYGTTSESNVYRWNADELTPSYVWHDFVSGNAGGDFVMLIDKMYISWKDDNLGFRLYEVTVDEDFNYVSHTDLGTIPRYTYGLASELGKLYGVTPEELYLIDLETFSFQTVITNPQPDFAWWGPAGLHEAMVLEASVYSNFNNANNATNQLTGVWINTIEGGELIYVRIENIINGEFHVVEAAINVFKAPQIIQPNDLEQCSDENVIVFDLTEVEQELLVNVDYDVDVSYHTKENDAINNINQISSTYLSNYHDHTAYVRVQNSYNHDCFNVTQFEIIIHRTPIIEPMTDVTEMRFISNCYINKNDQGYFKLNEIYNQIIIDDDANYTLEYYKTFFNAENSTNKLSLNYIGTIGLVEEIFVKVIDENSCSRISNFFIDGDCILTSLDVSSINFPNFITPNNDSYNDYWNVKGVSEFLRIESVINIYDRYGKHIYSFKPNDGKGWNGTFNGVQLPSSDYWFNLETPTGIIFRGHFALVY